MKIGRRLDLAHRHSLPAADLEHGTVGMEASVPKSSRVLESSVVST